MLGILLLFLSVYTLHFPKSFLSAEIDLLSLYLSVIFLSLLHKFDTQQISVQLTLKL